MLWSLFELIYYRLSAWWTWLDRSTSLIGWCTVGVPMVYYWCILCAIVYCFSTAYCCVLSCNLDFSYVLRCDLLYSDQLVCTASVLLFHSLCTVWVLSVYSGLQTCTVTFVYFDLICFFFLCTLVWSTKYCTMIYWCVL